MLLQNSVKVKGALAAHRKSTRPDQIVPLDYLGPGTLSVAFYARPS
jgi:hypothetical protein